MSRKTKCHWLAAAACIVASSCSSHLRAAILFLQPSADTTLFETYTNYNLGGINSLAAGTTVRNKRGRALVRFDFTVLIPSDAFIRDAWLELEVVRAPSSGGGTPSNFQLHRVLRDWGEGSKIGNGATGAPATPGEATWMARFHSTNVWAVPGAAAGIDYATMPTASQFVEGLGTYRWDFLVADVQFWAANSAANFGWILIGDREMTPGTARRFAAREDTNLPPVLTVVFEIPRPSITRMERVDGEARVRFQAAPNRSYRVQYRPGPVTGAWALLTNIPPASTNRSIVISDPMGPTNRFYRLAVP